MGRNAAPYAPRPWRIWVDTGGTFTDCIARDPEGSLHRAKVLSDGTLRGVVDRLDGCHLRPRVPWVYPEGFFRGAEIRLLRGGPTVAIEDSGAALGLLRLESPLEGMAPGEPFEILFAQEAPLVAARLVTSTAGGQPLPPVALRLATTRGTNALLERRGAATVLFITRGFGDLLVIGTQQRPDLFRLEVTRPPPLYERVHEVSERVAADGTVLEPLDLNEARNAALRCVGLGFRRAAVALLNAYRNPDHEQQLERLLLATGFEHVSCSAALAPRIKLLPRAETAVVNAYLSKVVEEYFRAVGAELDGGSLQGLTSAGGLVRASEFQPKDSLLSGPAGGVVGAARTGRLSGFSKILAFDMGGTSTDVSRYDGDFDYRYETRVGDARLMAPALAIETVAAGGGSICRFDGRQLKVGPQSAEARPGPACYGCGGPLTLTDVNLLLGRLDPAGFEIPIRVEAAATSASALLEEVRRSGMELTLEEMLSGLLEIANERMAEAVRRVSIRRGFDPADYTLVAFGGAGGQHACFLAGSLGIDAVLIPADAGLLSALGLGAALVERHAESQVLEALSKVEPKLEKMLDVLSARAAAEVVEEGIPTGQVEIRSRVANLRFAGQESTLEIEYAGGGSLVDSFLSAYERRFGYRPEGRSIEVESLRVVASSPGDRGVFEAERVTDTNAAPRSKRNVFFDGDWMPTPVVHREDLEPGCSIPSPALVLDHYSTTVIDPGWSSRIDATGSLLMVRPSRQLDKSVGRAIGDRQERHSEAVELELYTHRFEAIACEMGEMLRRTAVSVNIKERLDFSCAILDANGELVVNAPHIPVHLGALGLCVRRVAQVLDLGPGDVAVTNHPGFGGSHLPDVTVISPVFEFSTADSSHDSGGLVSEPGTERLLGYVASRAHHAEIGGSRPGSMPPDATCLAEEGVVLEPQFLVRGGKARWEEIRCRLREGRFPSRAVSENLADLAAAIAANQAGAVALGELARKHGTERLRHYMGELTGQVEQIVSDALQRFPAGIYSAEEFLDDGSPLRVTIELRGGGAVIDFEGSAPVHPGNLNATPAVVRSVVLYVLRLLIREPLPLNEGLLRNVEIRLPPGMLNPTFPADPLEAPAVVGGNVETSQRLVDTLVKALGLAACSQGTMNNLLFGNESFGYYETIAGGAGAGPGFHGADAVHTHMTNTAITDPEILENRVPVRLERFSIRPGSGGAGRFRGGRGVVRELTFLEPVSLSVVTQHRAHGPFGAAGGGPGSPGRQRIERSSGESEELGAVDGRELEPGDRLILETPGGGGWGAVEPSGAADS